MKSLSIFILIILILATVALVFTPSARAAFSFEDLVNMVHPPVQIVSSEGQRLAEKLEEHVKEYITEDNWSAFYVVVGESGGYFNFEEQRHDVQALSAALPYLTPATQNQAKQYLANFLIRRPLTDSSKQSPTSGYPRREHFVEPNGSIDFAGGSQHQNFLPTAALYALWLYGERSGDWTTVNSQWNQAKAYLNLSQSNYGQDLMEMSANLTGLIGGARIAKKLNDNSSYQQAITNGQTLMNAFTQQFNSDIGRQLNVGSGFMCQNVIDWNDNCAIQRTHVEPLPILIPEVGKRLGESSSNQLDNLKHIFDVWYPSWWITWGERPHGTSGCEDETETFLPDFGLSMYTIQVFTGTASPDRLKMWTDVAWCRADPYYLDRLVIAIEALETSGAATPTPSPSYKQGDIDGDGDVDKDDALAVLRNWLSSFPNPSRANANGDGKVNGVDFGYVIKDWEFKL